MNKFDALTMDEMLAVDGGGKKKTAAMTVAGTLFIGGAVLGAIMFPPSMAVAGYCLTSAGVGIGFIAGGSH